MSSYDLPPVTPDTDDAQSPPPDDNLSSPLSDPPSPDEPQKSEPPKRMPSLRSVSDPRNLNPNSTALGMLGKARNPALGSSSFAGRPGGGGALDGDLMKKAQALQRDRMKMGASPAASSPGSPAVPPLGTSPNGFPGMRMPNMPPLRPGPGMHHNSAPAMPTRSLGERRAKFGGGLKLSDMAPPPPSQSPGGMKRTGAPKLTDMAPSGDSVPASMQGISGSKLDDFKQYIDAEKGWITFDGAATITRTGVNFSNGQTFSISLDEVQIVGELGKGNYGTVYKVKHAKPAAPRFGHGLSGVKMAQIEKNQAASNGDGADPSDPKDKIMAMKEIRLELDDAKFTTILKELVILHQCVSPYIIDFYGAFYQDGAVYMCIEYMDGGSIDKLYGGGMPENILRKVTHATIMGLKCLKDDHSIIHRDVKPTNVLVNTRGQVKICDFGVSGNLVASIAKTNIGCQSYMAPERISGGGMAQAGGGSDGTYSVQSDVWSLGLTVIECALGRYPYPPEVSSTIFGQLNAIVEGEPPTLPDTGYSEAAHDFVASCVRKIPKMRPTYAMLLKHPWLSSLSKPDTIAEVSEEDEDKDVAADVEKLDLNAPSSGSEDEEVAAWVRSMLQGGDKGKDDESKRPALHAVPLDTVSPLGSPAPTTDDA